MPGPRPLPKITEKQAKDLFETLAGMVPGIGDALSVKDFIDNPTLAQGLWSSLAMIPGVPRAKMPRSWQDVPLKGSARTTKKDIPTKFLEEHGFKELKPGEKPAPNTFRYTDEGKIEAFSAVSGPGKKQGLSQKTFSEATTLKTMRNWMGY